LHGLFPSAGARHRYHGSGVAKVSRIAPGFDGAFMTFLSRADRDRERLPVMNT